MTRRVISNKSHEVCEHRLLSSCGDDSDSSLDTSNRAAHAMHLGTYLINTNSS